MLRSCGLSSVFALTMAGALCAADIKGDYVEMRTCDVYTGPCFANSQVGLTGQQAILAWSIETGSYQGIDLTGLNVVMTVRANDTLGFGSGVVIHPDPIRSVILVDSRANSEQQQALAAFARQRAGAWPAPWPGSRHYRSSYRSIMSIWWLACGPARKSMSRRASSATPIACARMKKRSTRRSPRSRIRRRRTRSMRRLPVAD